MTSKIELAEMTSYDIQEAIDNGFKTVVFAVGSNEQHGPCLPVSTDAILGDNLALLVAQKLGKALKSPTINIGCSEHHMKFLGTITLSKKTLQTVVKEYVDSLVRHGFKRVIVLPSHGGNFNPLNEIAKEVQEVHPNVKIIIYSHLLDFFSKMTETGEKFGVSPESSGAHAGEAEVSMMMWVRNDLVKEELIKEARGYIGKFDEDAANKVFNEGIGALSPIGVLGDPTKASLEHGRQYFEDLASSIVEYIKQQ
jgi:creatinine amidohydrolase